MISPVSGTTSKRTCLRSIFGFAETASAAFTTRTEQTGDVALYILTMLKSTLT